MTYWLGRGFIPFTVRGVVGPEPTTYRDLIRKIGRLMSNDLSVGSVPVWTAKLGAAIIGPVSRAGHELRGSRGAGGTPTTVSVAERPC